MSDGKAVLLVAETVEGSLVPITAELTGAARTLAQSLGSEVVTALLGHQVAGLTDELGALGADRVAVADHPLLADYQAETYVSVLDRLVDDLQPAVVLLGQTFQGRELGPRLAYDKGTSIVTDCVRLAVDGERVVMSKPVYGGSAMADFVVETSPQMATVRPRAFDPPEPQPGRSCEVQQVTVELDSSALRTRVDETVREVAEGVSLKDAAIIVSGGRGLGGPENWHYVEELAESLGAAVGATRAVTDAGWVPASIQVGLTGVTVSPDLYIAVGISGAVQHLAGISGAKNVVAINKDPEANIFKLARFGYAGDWKEFVPALTAKVKELRGA